KKKVNLKSVVTLSVAVAVLLIAVLVNKIVYNNVTLNGLNRQLEEIKAQTGGLEKIDLEYRSLTHYVDALN
ncbi:MAG: hypothetical protein GWM98_10200, partial [Nitrospinaceae bacterium]|nr:hypothetical protein [Nitrospinaceae bacterium]NIR54791.1 hypothetical protein [Nitrospinaceae bacterium]NIS85217.1 hypothetical protein [Nitrospinaceae bacterium]NIT82027.1 hypothetical protein [Nitrospinaceae bacterium]NIU44291.1 hypothetical protein [Nitrospinaceae bacterium]